MSSGNIPPRLLLKSGARAQSWAAAPGYPGQVRVLLGTLVSLSMNGAPLIFTAFHVEKLMLLLANHFLHDSHTEPPLLQNLFLIKTFSLLS